MNILEIKDLKKIYKIKSKNKKEFTEVSALDGINLTIKEGEFVSIIGPSGSGKSTLMQIMGLLDNASAGSIKFLGKDITKMNDNEISDLRRNYIGFVFQFFNLLSRTTALDNVNLPLIYSRHSSKDKASRLLDMVGLSERKKHKPNQLSGGQQQRVAIARALVNDPKIIFADEPTGNISQAQSKEVMSYFSRLNADGVTIVLVTHDPKVAEQAKRIITIKDGKVESDVENSNFKTEINVDKVKEENNEVGSDSVVDVVEENKENNSIFSRFIKSLVSVMNLSFLKENISVAYKSLVSNKFRTFLSVFGITIGITAVVTMVSLGEGTKENIKKQFEGIGSNRIQIQRNEWKRGNRNINDMITFKDYELIKTLQKNYPIEYVARSRSVSWNDSVVVSYLDKNYTLSDASQVMFVDRSYYKINDLKFKLGSFFTEKQEENKEKVCVIGPTIYNNLFKKGENPVGKKIYISQIHNGKSKKSLFTIVGLVELSGSDAWGDDQGELIFIPYSTWEQRFVMNRWEKSWIHQILIKVKSSDDVNYMKDILVQKLAERRNITDIKSTPETEWPFIVMDSATLQKARTEGNRVLSTLLIIIACISLFVGGIGIMNIMIVSVKERTREIGLRKALGARKLDVLFQFIVEAIMIGLIGGGAGIILGGIISSIMSIWIASVLSWKMVFIAFGFSFVVALVFGYLPAKRAAELSPVEALRYE